MNWKTKTLTSPDKSVRIAMEIHIFSSTQISWNHKKGFHIFQTERNNRDHNPLVGVVLQQASEKRTNKVLTNKKNADSIDLNLRKVILLDIQSTMDLLFNEDILDRI